MNQRKCRFNVLLLIFVCFLTITGCRASHDVKTEDRATSLPSVKMEGTSAKAPQFDLTGIWKSSILGEMTLRQSGNTVTGVYDCNDGQLAGVVEGNRFVYDWWEHSPGRPYKKAFKTHRGDGYFDISKNGKRLKGKWRLEGVKKWGGNWQFSWRSNLRVKKIK
ncbi:MAG: hypothetical protein JRC86_05895 [Deltaproteobacteria bacterium]|nr:hypothetical protein [Deltaproteobacteria bacterium]